MGADRNVGKNHYADNLVGMPDSARKIRHFRLVETFRSLC
jgi:hypothetical protein